MQDFTETALDIKPEDLGWNPHSFICDVCGLRLSLPGTKSEKGQESSL